MTSASGSEAVEVSAAARHLAHAMQAYKPEARFAPCPPSLLADIARHLPLSPELELWYSTLAPAETFYVLQPGNDLRLCPPAELVEAQLGYRWGSLPDESGDERFEEWKDDWVVIADIGADAIIAHIGLPGTPVFFSPHGEGEWDLSPMAPSLVAYLEGLARWIEIALIGTGAMPERCMSATISWPPTASGTMTAPISLPSPLRYAPPLARSSARSAYLSGSTERRSAQCRGSAAAITSRAYTSSRAAMRNPSRV